MKHDRIMRPRMSRTILHRCRPRTEYSLDFGDYRAASDDKKASFIDFYRLLSTSNRISDSDGGIWCCILDYLGFFGRDIIPCGQPFTCSRLHREGHGRDRPNIRPKCGQTCSVLTRVWVEVMVRIGRPRWGEGTEAYWTARIKAVLLRPS